MCYVCHGTHLHVMGVETLVSFLLFSFFCVNENRKKEMFYIQALERRRRARTHFKCHSFWRIHFYVYHTHIHAYICAYIHFILFDFFRSLSLPILNWGGKIDAYKLYVSRKISDVVRTCTYREAQWKLVAEAAFFPRLFLTGWIFLVNYALNRSVLRSLELKNIQQHCVCEREKPAVSFQTKFRIRLNFILVGFFFVFAYFEIGLELA